MPFGLDYDFYRGADPLQVACDLQGHRRSHAVDWMLHRESSVLDQSVRFFLQVRIDGHRISCPLVTIDRYLINRAIFGERREEEIFHFMVEGLRMHFAEWMTELTAPTPCLLTIQFWTSMAAHLAKFLFTVAAPQRHLRIGDEYGREIYPREPAEMDMATYDRLIRLISDLEQVSAQTLGVALPEPRYITRNFQYAAATLPRVTQQDQEEFRRQRDELQRENLRREGIERRARQLLSSLFPTADPAQYLACRSREIENMAYVIPPHNPERVHIFHHSPVFGLFGYLLEQPKWKYLGYLCIVYQRELPLGDKYAGLLLRLRAEEKQVWSEVYQHIASSRVTAGDPEMMLKITERMGGARIYSTAAHPPDTNGWPNCIPAESWLY